MKVYIVTESEKESNLILRSWVCFTKEQADACIRENYKIACSVNSTLGIAEPTNCLDMDFFFWKMANDFEVRFIIEESQTYSE